MSLQHFCHSWCMWLQ